VPGTPQRQVTGAEMLGILLVLVVIFFAALVLVGVGASAMGWLFIGIPMMAILIPLGLLGGYFAYCRRAGGRRSHSR
jgi:hypothetical protein